MNGDDNKNVVEKIMAELRDEIKKYNEAVASKVDPAALKKIIDKKDGLLKQLTGFYLQEKENKKKV